jgi:hypothetical protein
MRSGVFLVLCLGLLAASPLPAQKNTTSVSSTVPDRARFEILESPLLATLTFRLDRFTGDTWQLVSTKDSTYAWQPVPQRAQRHRGAGQGELPNLPEWSARQDNTPDEHEHRCVLVRR